MLPLHHPLPHRQPQFLPPAWYQALALWSHQHHFSHSSRKCNSHRPSDQGFPHWPSSTPELKKSGHASPALTQGLWPAAQRRTRHTAGQLGPSKHPTCRGWDFSMDPTSPISASYQCISTCSTPYSLLTLAQCKSTRLQSNPQTWPWVHDAGGGEDLSLQALQSTEAMTLAKTQCDTQYQPGLITIPA